MIGETISHYKIVEKLGEGGMGVVYKAEDTRLDRVVALKFLSAHLLENEEALERFVHEAKAAATLDHPNICTIHEIDKVEGQMFLAMAYVEGDSLADKVKKRPLPLEEALEIAVQAADGLHAAHKKGVIIYAVGIGSAAGEPIPEIDDNGNAAGYMKHRGETVMTRLDEAALRQIADAGGGRYIHSATGGVGISEVHRELARLQKAEFESRLFVQFDEKYQWVLWPALAFLLAGTLPGERRKRRLADLSSEAPA